MSMSDVIHQLEWNPVGRLGLREWQCRISTLRHNGDPFRHDCHTATVFPDGFNLHNGSCYLQIARPLRKLDAHLKFRPQHG